MRHTIQLYCTPAGWMARESDPEVRRLFGTTDIPTAWTAHADAQPA